MTSKTSELSAGVEILIARLESHPEEFFGSIREGNLFGPEASPKFSRWKSIIEDDLAASRGEPREDTRHTWFMTDAEKTALLDAYRKARRLRFDSEVVAALYETPEPEPKPSQVAFRRTNPNVRLGMLGSRDDLGVGITSTWIEGVR